MKWYKRGKWTSFSVFNVSTAPAWQLCADYRHSSRHRCMFWRLWLCDIVAQPPLDTPLGLTPHDLPSTHTHTRSAFHERSDYDPELLWMHGWFERLKGSGSHYRPESKLTNSQTTTVKYILLRVLWSFGWSNYWRSCALQTGEHNLRDVFRTLNSLRSCFTP